MTEPLRILHLEDDPLDTELVDGLLCADGLVAQIERVDTLAEFQDALEHECYALILSDYTLPGTDPMEALRLARRLCPHVPFIFLSGTMGEDTAIESLKMGASDYVLKQRMARLAPAVRRALAEAEEQARRQRAEEALRESERFIQSVAQASPHWLYVFDLDSRSLSYANRPILDDLGYPLDVQRAALTLDAFRAFMPAEEMPHLARLMEEWQTLPDGQIRNDEYCLRRADGQLQYFAGRETVFARRADGTVQRILGLLLDITERKQAEEALRESRERLERAQEIAHLGSWELDLVGNRLTWSDEVYRIFGLQPREFDATYEAFLDRVHPDDRAAVDAAYSGSLREGRDTYEIEHRVVRKSTGEIRIVHEKCEHVRDASGRIVRSIGMVHDITERKRAQETLRMSEEKFRTLHALSPIAIVLNRLDNGQFLESNQALWDMTGYTEEEFRSLTYWDITPIEYQDMEAKQLELLHTVGRYGPYEKEYIRKDGSRFPVLLSGVRIKDPGGTDLIYSVIQDITELKAKEQALRELNATLEDRVAHRTAELRYRASQLQKLALELSQAEERERRRIAVILHEDLQQQIAGAKFHLSLVKGRAKEDRQRMDLDQVDGMLKEAIEKSRSLSTDLSPAVLHMNDLAELLQWLVNRVRGQQGLHVHLEVQGDMMLQSEALATFLFRAAQEMLFNAVKHARVKEARIRVRRVGRCMCLSVSDQGQGFDPQELKETSGIGLFSIRERTELLGGRMKVKSAKGQGSRLSLMVPDSKSMVVPAPSGVSIPQPGAAELHSDGRLRVLLVDDHDIVREGLAALLREAAGIELVGEASDGRSAINLAIDLRPDVVIMDVSMPLMSGDQATRQIKTQLPKTRVIGLSMYDEADKKEKMFEAGAEGYILKTVSAEDLIAAIRGPSTGAS